jgi:hypothetical protein
VLTEQETLMSGAHPDDYAIAFKYDDPTKLTFKLQVKNGKEFIY